jgi:hypothetical protein
MDTNVSEQESRKLTRAALAEHNGEEVVSAHTPSFVYRREDSKGNRESGKSAESEAAYQAKEFPANQIFKKSPVHDTWRQIGEGNSKAGCHASDFDSLNDLLNKAMRKKPDVEEAFRKLMYRPEDDNRETGFYDIRNLKNNYKKPPAHGENVNWIRDGGRNDGSINIFFDPARRGEAKRLRRIILAANEYYKHPDTYNVLSADQEGIIEDWRNKIASDNTYHLDKLESYSSRGVGVREQNSLDSSNIILGKRNRVAVKR